MTSGHSAQGARSGRARWTCESCSQRFERAKSGDRPIRFCSSSCYQDWRRKNGQKNGCFKAGSRPWNKGMEGIHLNRATEWVKGQESDKRVPIGTVTIRKRRRERHQRAFVKVADPNRWRPRASVEWERVNGPLPKGMVIHHRDRNPLNDDPLNLEAMTRAEHAREHMRERQGNLL